MRFLKFSDSAVVHEKVSFSIMDHRVTAVERAFQLAGSGSCSSVADIKAELKAEGYSVDQIFGRALHKQLLAICKTAKGADAGSTAGIDQPD